MVLYKVLSTAGRPVLHPVTECRLYQAGTCTIAISVKRGALKYIYFIYTLLFRTKSRKKAWTTDRFYQI